MTATKHPKSSNRVASKTLHTLVELNAAGLISDTETSALQQVAERYSIAVTPQMAALIDKTDPADPMARQFIPTIAELDHRPGEHEDPIGDHLKSPVRGIVHRYADRVLLKAVSVCPVYCRFCFRREMVGPKSDQGLSEAELKSAFDYIAAHEEIWEVIITGGDPLILSPRRIREITHALSQIKHVRIVRWHTRVPAVSPELITQDLVEALCSTQQSTYLALHANHPDEMTLEARTAIRLLASHGITLLGQTVLLRGVNDDAETLERLMRAFVETGIKPYYLHHPDLAPGTGHFRVSIDAGQQLVRELRRRLSGIALPNYVLDIPGAHGKVPIGPQHVEACRNGEGYTLTDRNGFNHSYRDHC